MTNGRTITAMPSLGSAFLLGLATGTLMSHAQAAQAAVAAIETLARVFALIA